MFNNMCEKTLKKKNREKTSKVRIKSQFVLIEKSCNCLRTGVFFLHLHFWVEKGPFFRRQAIFNKNVTAKGYVFIKKKVVIF